MNRSNKSTAPNQSGPIIAGNCISCMGMVRISHSMSVNTTVRCPHCQQSFVLADLLDQSLPPLEIVANGQSSGQESDIAQEDAPYIDTLHLKRDEQADRPEKPRVKFQIPKALRDGAKKKRRRRRSRSSSSSNEKSSAGPSNFVIPSSSGTSDASTSADSTTMGEAVERRRSRSRQSSSSSERRSSSSQSGGHAPHRGKVSTHVSRLKDQKTEFNILAMLKVAFGCLFAFSMAYLMLIWIFKADPFGVAPNISKSVPFAIPSSMQNGKEPEVEVDLEPERELPSYLTDDNVEPFVPKSFSEDANRIAVPDIDPDEVFGQEFGF